MKPTLTHLGFVCSLGNSTEEIYQNLINFPTSNNIIKNSDIKGVHVPFFACKVEDKHILRFQTLIDVALDQIKAPVKALKSKYPLHRLAIVIGSSNTGVNEAKEHIKIWLKENKCPPNFSFDELELGTPALYLKEQTGFEGPCYTVSTACSSSANAFKSAQNLLDSDICDAVLVGGVDEKCSFALNGFYALEALSLEKCLPFSKNRTGINLGEGAALFLMQKEGRSIKLKGIGQSSDAYHLTHPDPQGNGAENAMKLALKDAHLEPKDIDYINLHGTGTTANDDMESKAVFRVFGTRVPCASTKPLTGHTLGAAGAIEAALSFLMLKYGFIIDHIYDNAFDPNCAPILMAKKQNIKPKRILSNSFAFGGSNTSIILEHDND